MPNITANTAGIIKVPETTFHIKDRIQVTQAPAICGILSSVRYFGHRPTKVKATTDKNGRNQNITGLISTQAGNVRKAIAIIHIVKILPFFNK